MKIPPLRAACRLAWLAACAVLSVVPASASPTAEASHGPVSPLPKANAFQVHETTYFSDLAGILHPHETLTVRFARPNRYWIEERLAEPKGAEKPSVYVSDGTTEYEYDGAKNRYARGPAAKPGETPAQRIKMLYNVAKMGVILDPRLNALTWTQDRLDGKPVWVHSRATPVVQVRGKTISMTNRYWEDARTGLLCRHSLYQTEQGKTRELIRTDFTHWVLDQPLPADRFAWSPPPGAAEYVVPPTPVLLAAGTPAPDFAVTTPDGRTVHLSDYKGRPVVLDFWATWCAPCQESMPHLEKVYKQLKDQGVAVLAVCVWDKKDAYDKWAAAKRGTFTFPTAFDSAGNDNATSIASHLYGVSGIPTQYVIDKSGKVAAAYDGYEDGEHRLEDALGGLGIKVETPASPAAAAGLADK